MSWARRAPPSWPSRPCRRCWCSSSATRWREASGTAGGPSRATSSASWCSRPGLPGPPARSAGTGGRRTGAQWRRRHAAGVVGARSSRGTHRVGVLALTSFGTPLVARAAGAGASTPADDGPDLLRVSAPLTAAHAVRPADGGRPRRYAVRAGRHALAHRGRSPRRRRRLDLARRAQPRSRPRRRRALRGPGSAPDRAGVCACPPMPDARPTSAVRRTGAPRRPPRAAPGHLPELIALGLGLRGLRRIRPGAPGAGAGWATRFSGDPIPAPASSEGALDAATLLQRFAGVPALHSFEAANCLLGLALEGRRHPVRGSGRSASRPPGVTFCFAGAEPGEPPRGLRPRGRRHRVARRPRRARAVTTRASRYLPVVLPVGDDAEGTWLVPLEPGDVLPLLGRGGAGALARRTRRRRIVGLVGDDPGDRGSRRPRAPRRGARPIPSWPGTCSSAVTPASLPPAVAARCAVVTMEPVAASDLTILVDRRAATLHPMGLVVRPHLQSAETAQHMAELVAPPPDRGSDASDVAAASRMLGPPAMRRTSGPSRRTRTDALVAGSRRRPPPDHDAPARRARTNDLPPNRARRAVELVAYLALHQPDVVTSDRLRTRVLGSSDADAAAKTLFNTAYAARRAMGVDEQGDPLFPAGTRAGSRTSSRHGSPSTCSVPWRSAAEAKAQSDPAAAIAYFRAALDAGRG